MKIVDWLRGLGKDGDEGKPDDPDSAEDDAGDGEDDPTVYPLW